MDKEEAAKVLALVKACWQEQAIDALVLETWCGMLSDLPFNCALAAVKERVRAGLARPSLAEVYRETEDCTQRELLRLRLTRRALMEPAPSKEEVARNQKFLHRLIVGLAR